MKSDTAMIAGRVEVGRRCGGVLTEARPSEEVLTKHGFPTAGRRTRQPGHGN